MAQPQSNPKVEELRFRLKTDSKSRLFYPLAEELRKISRYDEAEQTLRTGLAHHPTYLSAWVSLGRVLRDQHKNEEAVEALKKALQLDPGNVVAARLLADAYLALGDKLEAIKKYKLVHALLPADQELLAVIDRLDRDLNPPFPAPAEEPPPPPAEAEETPFAAPAAPLEDTKPHVSSAKPEPEYEHQATIETPFADETRDEEPMAAAHEDSPFEETATGFTSASLTVERPVGIHIEPAPLAAEVPAPVVAEEESPFEAAPEPLRATDDVTNTPTMADLYVQQGLADDARQIYENILQRDPENAEVRTKLEALSEAPSEAEETPAPPDGSRAARVTKLQNWLAKIREERGHV
jgi:tetratricopeptide (TPR) repeat protein